MNERDIPSVPITTLAGVASLTDCKYVNNISKIKSHFTAETIKSQ